MGNRAMWLVAVGTVVFGACGSSDQSQTIEGAGRTDHGIVWNNPSNGITISALPSPNSIGEPNTSLPQPTFEGDGVTVRIDYLLWVGAGTVLDESGFTCGDEAEIWKEDTGNVPATECLVVGWDFDVAADVTDGDGDVVPYSLITPEIYEIRSVVGFAADAGEKNNHAISSFAGGKPSSTLFFNATGGDEPVVPEFRYEVPPAYDFVPLV